MKSFLERTALEFNRRAFLRRTAAVRSACSPA